jgi:MT0933-like antitoxin protein
MDALTGDQVDQAAEKADEASGGKHTDKIDKGRDMAKEHLDKHQAGTGE